MKSVNQNLVFRQLLSNLPENILACPIMNYDAKKITDFSIVKVFIMANVAQWKSHRQIEAGIQAEPEFQKEIETDFISHSQISRRLIQLNTAHLVELFSRLAVLFWRIKGDTKGLNANVGPIRIIDGTYVKLPSDALSWTAVSKDSAGIKLHVRIVVASANSVYPEKMIPSTGNVADSDAVNHIIDADGALYIMDRGYAHKTKMGGWMERKVHFLVRAGKNFSMETLKSYAPTQENVLRNELVSILTREEPLRYIEFVDDKGTHFHLLTNRLDLSEEEIMEAYRNRCYIELFFKWLKQHVKIDHLFSKSPIGIWNQMYIALITVALTEIMRLIHLPKRTLWTLFSNLKPYLFKSIRKILSYLNRKKRKSKGRQKVPKTKEKLLQYGDVAIASPIDKDHFIEKEKKKKALEKNKKQQPIK
ncbi:IS4 family transposase [Sporosarcina thermotolerans]|uniref:IS4 family transposase n=1 Tax=Sporosarcina thermotolerans TaxID=633404 RepID=A0AAW9A7P2_9BACL|nr:IS4 family transposase [Sporosarcina thermotolerans]MDW0116239.1 IS4 family transposase [Sporosarcina thermotolerans]